jgi:hypothetical protein
VLRQGIEADATIRGQNKGEGIGGHDEAVPLAGTFAQRGV